MKSKKKLAPCVRERDCPSYPMGDILAGIASEYMVPLSALPPARKKIVLLARVSTGRQGTKGNLRRLRQEAEQLLHDLGFSVIRVFEGIENATIWNDRIPLVQAVAFCRQHNLPLVVFSRDRIIRNDLFYRTRETERPTINEYRCLRRITAGVKLVTILHPDSEVAHSWHTKRGIRASRKKSGRREEYVGWSKTRALRYAHWALARKEQKWGNETIAEEINRFQPYRFRPVCENTIRNWLKKLKRDPQFFRFCMSLEVRAQRRNRPTLRQTAFHANVNRI